MMKQKIMAKDLRKILELIKSILDKPIDRTAHNVSTNDASLEHNRQTI